MNWQADIAVTFRNLVESEKAAKGTRQHKLKAVSDRKNPRGGSARAKGEHGGFAVQQADKHDGGRPTSTSARLLYRTSVILVTSRTVFSLGQLSR